MTPNPEITQILPSGEVLARRKGRSITTSAPSSELEKDLRDTENRDEPSLPKKGAAIVPTDVSLARTQVRAGLATMQVNGADDLGDARSLRRPSVVTLGTAMGFDPRAAHGVLFGERMGNRVDLDGDDLIIMKEPDDTSPIG